MAPQQIEAFWSHQEQAITDSSHSKRLINAQCRQSFAML